MEKKQKKFDVGKLVQKISEEKLRFLWQERTLNENFATDDKNASSISKSKTIDRRKPVNLLETDNSATHNKKLITNIQKPKSQDLPATRLDSDVDPRRTTYQLQASAVDGNELMSFTTSPAARSIRKKEVVRALAGFTAICLLLLSTFPILGIIEKNRQARGAVLGVATGAYEHFSSASSALLESDFVSASAGFTQAYNDFSLALAEFSGLSAAAGLLPEGETAKELLLSAVDASLAMQYLSRGMEGIATTRLGKEGISTASDKEASIVFSDSLTNIRLGLNYLQGVESRLQALNTKSVPKQYQSQIETISTTFSATADMFNQASGMLDLLMAISTGGKQKFLLLFQNHRELRATGGFIGTYGLLELNNANIENLKIESVYNPDGQLKELIAAPGPLQRQLTPTWGMRDSNWFFDFPTSASKAAKFYKLETDIEVAGVLAFTPALFENLMHLTGPVEMPEYGQTLTAENFTDIVQYETSFAYDRVLNQPKKFLSDFAPKMLERISAFTTNQWLEFIDIVMLSLVRRDILAADLAGNLPQIEKLGWSGELRQAPHDFLAVAHTNVGAGKTDQDISQEISLESILDGEGGITNTLTITRAHVPGAEKEFPVNIDFMRIYVPLGADLVSATGFDSFPYSPASGEGREVDADLAAIDSSVLVHADSGTQILRESGKTVFANWLELAPGQTKTIRLEYKLPMQYNTSSAKLSAHSILVQRQPGAPPTNFSFDFVNASGLSPLWTHSSSQQQNGQYKSALQQDFVWGTILNKAGD